MPCSNRIGPWADCAFWFQRPPIVGAVTLVGRTRHAAPIQRLTSSGPLPESSGGRTR